MEQAFVLLFERYYNNPSDAIISLADNRSDRLCGSFQRSGKIRIQTADNIHTRINVSQFD